MGYDGSGTFNRQFSWQADADAEIGIDAVRMDGEDDNFANGLSQCITRDGQSTIIADLSMNGYRLRGQADPLSPGDGATKRWVDENFVKATGNEKFSVGDNANPGAPENRVAVILYPGGLVDIFRKGSDEAGERVFRVLRANTLRMYITADGQIYSPDFFGGTSIQEVLGNVLDDFVALLGRTVSAGLGLTGGGSLAANRVIALSSASIASLAKADTAIQPEGAVDLAIGTSISPVNLNNRRAVLINADGRINIIRPDADPATSPTLGSYHGDDLNFLVRASGEVNAEGNMRAPAFVVVSDVRQKYVHGDTGSTLAALNELSVVQATMKNEPEDAAPRTMLLAQNVQTIPLLAHLAKEGADGVLTMNYAGLVPALVKAVQELSARVEALEASR